MDHEWQRAAKARLVDGMLRGESWQDAVIASGLNLGRSGAYRLTWRVCVQGETALDDHRQGHVSKMHPAVVTWLEASCRAAPGTSSRVVQAALQERFGLMVSIGHLNRVRATLGVGSGLGRGGKRTRPRNRTRTEPAADQRGATGVSGAAPAR